MKELRRKDRAISKGEAMDLLNKAQYGVLSTVSEDKEPYGVPLSFCIVDNCIYFHCAVEGHKIDNVRQNKQVSFCVVGETEVLPDKFGTKYESAIVQGEIAEVFELDKRRGLEGLLYKYSSGYIDQGKKYIEALEEKTMVFRISISSLSGKARRH